MTTYCGVDFHASKQMICYCDSSTGEIISLPGEVLLNYFLTTTPAPEIRRFKSPGHAQRFLSAFGVVSQQFKPKCHQFTAQQNRDEVKLRFASWQEVVCLPSVA